MATVALTASLCWELVLFTAVVAYLVFSGLRRHSRGPQSEKLGGGHVELTVTSTGLPPVSKTTLETGRKLVVRRELPDMLLDGLARFQLVDTLTVVGPAPLSKAALEAVGQMPSLQTLDLQGCRTVVDSNNSVAGLCTAEDILDLHLRTRLERLVLPPVCAVEVGVCTQSFKKSRVTVVQLPLSRTLRLGDQIVFRRREGLGMWTSQVTTVTSIRTDAGVQVLRASGGQFAVLVAEVGKRGDAVVWIGHDSRAALETM